MPEDENMNAGAASRDAGADLYRKWLCGDGKAFDKIIEIYHDALIFFAYGTVKNFADAEDIAADVFADVIVHPRRYSFGCSLKTYLFSVARNKAVDRIRRRKHFSDEDISESAENVSDEKLIEDRIIADEKAKAVRDALKEINPDYAMALRLTYCHEFSGDEICIIMNKNKKQTANLIYRGKEALRKILVERGIESL